MLKDLEEGLINQRSNKRIIILVNKGLMFRSLRQRFKLKDKDKLRVNLMHLVYYILVQIIYIDNQYNIYKALKVKNKKYLVRIYQTPDERKYRNAKYMYRWHLVDNTELNKLTLQLGRYLTEECLEGRQWLSQVPQPLRRGICGVAWPHSCHSPTLPTRANS